METLFLVLSLLASLTLPAPVQGWIVGDVSKGFRDFEASLLTFSDRLGQTRGDMKQLSRQVMLQQFAAEEKIRSDGFSGIKQIRHDHYGPANYFTASHQGRSPYSIHTHSDHVRTVGLGELTVVMNGIEFRTRHNDYELWQASKTSNEYDATEIIEFPEIPPEVSNQPTVHDQVMEMREWYRAFKQQNTTHRDYRPYFIPLFCYMEGAWTLDENVTTLFISDRHFLNANSWWALQEKARYYAMAGGKSFSENHAYLPTAILNVDPDTGEVTYARWNYRILCHQLNSDLPLEWLKPVDDVAHRVRFHKSWERMQDSFGSRYTLYAPGYDENIRWMKFDEIFSQIPGKDVIPTFTGIHKEGKYNLYSAGNDTSFIPLNPFYYHRQYRYDHKDAMGVTTINRGYSDSHVWIAHTTNPRVAPLKMKECESINGHRECSTKVYRFSYAIPLEIIFMTPQHRWNPYNLTFYENETIIRGANNERDGKEDSPFIGIGSEYNYKTPLEFSDDAALQNTMAASTSLGTVYTTAPDNNVYAVKGSGIGIRTLVGGDVGLVRQRFPVAPVHMEGSPIWKELNALKQSVINSGIIDGDSKMRTLELGPADDGHTHKIEIHERDLVDLLSKEHLIEITDYCHGHDHKIYLKYEKLDENTQRFYYSSCDGQNVCPDGHDTTLSTTHDLSWMLNL